MKMYTACKENGDFIERVLTIEQGLALIEQYERDDEENENYEEDFYELECEDHTRVNWLYDERGEKVIRGDTIQNHDGVYLVKDIRHNQAEVMEVIFDEELGDMFSDTFWKTEREIKNCWKM